MAAARRSMARPRKERNRPIPDPQVPPRPPKGKVGGAGKTTIRRTKQPLRSARKVSE